MNLKQAILPALVAVLGAGMISSLTAAEKRPIIDVHVHSGEGPEGFLPGGPPYQLCHDPFVLADPATRIKPDGIRRLGDIYECPGNEMLSPMTNAEWKTGLFDAFKEYNYVAVFNSDTDVDRIERWTEELPVFSIPSLVVWKGSPDIAEVTRLVETGRIKAIGEIAIQYDGMAANDPFLDPYYALAQKHDIPVAIHITGGAPGNDYIGYHTTHTYRSDLTSPLLMEDVLRRYPDLRVFVMHAGWPMVDEMLLLMYMHPQVYVDIAMILTVVPRKEVHRWLKILVEGGMGKRIMFGTDHAVWPQIVGESVEAIESADFLTEEQKSDIFFNNAVRFFRLDAEELLKSQN